MQRIKNFFKEIPGFQSVCLILSGVDPVVARTFPKHEQYRLAAPGLAILVGSLLAFLGGWHTIHGIVDSNSLAILGGLMWMVIIVSMDYQIVISLTKHNGNWMALIRVLTACVLSLLISTPLVLLMCKGPVNELIQTELKLKTDSLYLKLIAEKKSKAALLEPWVAKVESRHLDFKDEVNGAEKNSTRKIGYGPNAKRKELEYLQAKQDLEKQQNAYSIDTLQLNRKFTEEFKKLSTNYATDELAKIRALFKLSSDPAIAFRWILLTLALFLLETLPLTIKLCMARVKTMYNIYQENILATAQTDQRKHLARCNAEAVGHEMEEQIHTQVVNLNAQVDYAKQKSKGFAEAFKDITSDARSMRASIETHNLSAEAHAQQNSLVDEWLSLQVKNLMSEISIFKKEKEQQLEQHQNDQEAVFVPVAKGEYFTVMASNISNTHPLRMNASMLDVVSKLAKVKNENKRLEGIYEYVHDLIPYDYAHGDFKAGYRTAEEVWRDRKGICGESSYLLIALCRTAGLSASYALVDVDNKGIEVNHACAYLKLADGTTQLVDVAYHLFNANHKQYRVIKDDEMNNLFLDWRRIKSA